MVPESTKPPPPAAGKSPEDKLLRNVRELCLRIVRGKAAGQNPSVWMQRVLGITSIVLSALGGLGIVATGNLPEEPGWPFWGSAIVLLFGILSQIANFFQVAQRAIASESLAVRCGLYETRLADILIDDDPQTAVADLFVEVTTLFQSERYNVVLPRETQNIKDEAKRLADDLIARHRGFWQLKVKKQKGVPRSPQATPPAADEPPGSPE